MSVRVVRRASSPKAKPSIGKTLRNIGVFVFAVFGFALCGFSIYAFRELQEAAGIVQNLNQKVALGSGEPTVILSADGTELFSMATEFRKPVDIKDIPEVVRKTTLAAEDVRFYQHTGVDLIAVGRIMLDAALGGQRRGASTITMQIAKNVYTGDERTLRRKFEQMAVAVQIERLMTKDLILETYLNQSYYGEGAYGVAAAAEVYFDKNLKDLTLGEAALLARIVRRPSDQNPKEDYEVAIRNRNVVLKIMLDEGMVTPDEYRAALNEVPKISDQSVRLTSDKRRAPFFVDYVMREVKRVLPDVDIKTGGYRVETTLNWDIQRAAETDLIQTVNGWRSIRTGASVTIDIEGKILSMVGGPDYKANQFNSAASARRQPGSAFKPFVYLAAAQSSIVSSPYSSVDNTKIFYREGGRTRTVKGGGPDSMVSLSTALKYSYNRAAWNTIRRVGPAQVVRLANNELGFKGDLPAVPSLSLGTGEVSPLEMAQAYTVFPLKGRRANVFSIERIIGPNGLPVYVAEPSFVKTSFSARSTEILDRCMREVVTSGGTGSAAGSIRNARGKTGTTNENKDAWFAGYTNNYVTVVWFANPVRSGNVLRYQPMGDAVMGGRVGAPTWASIMRDVQRVKGEEEVQLRWETLSGSASEDEEAPRRRRRTNEDPDGDGVTGPGEMPVVTEDRSRPVQVRDETPGDTPERREETRTRRETPSQDSQRDPASGDGATGEVVEPRRTTAPPAAPRREDPPPRRTQEDAEISVSVCADSGQRATVYCPEKVTRKFRRGTEPRGRCPIHGPSHQH